MPPPPVSAALLLKVKKRKENQKAKLIKKKERACQLAFKTKKFFQELEKVEKQKREEKEKELAAGYITLWVQVRAGMLISHRRPIP